jgi:hypothetical protein
MVRVFVLLPLLKSGLWMAQSSLCWLVPVMILEIATTQGSRYMLLFLFRSHCIPNPEACLLALEASKPRAGRPSRPCPAKIHPRGNRTVGHRYGRRGTNKDSYLDLYVWQYSSRFALVLTHSANISTVKSSTVWRTPYRSRYSVIGSKKAELVNGTDSW